MTKTMGNLCCATSVSQVVECIQQLQDVERTLECLVQKYDKQIAEQRRLAKQKMHRRADCMRHVRTVHMIRHHKRSMENRLFACQNKRYQLESLNVTKMHIRAVKTTTITYKNFLRQHDLDKVEQLQDTLADMIEDACAINETLAETPAEFEVDEDELEREYETLCSELQLPEAPTDIPATAEEQHALELVPLTAS